MIPGKFIFFLLAGCITLFPFLLAGREKGVNKTPYRLPGKAEFIKRLAAGARIAEREKSKAPLCLSFRIKVILERDYSGRVEFVEEYFLPTAPVEPLREDYKGTFVEMILPNGTYLPYHSPKRVPRIGGSLVYIKYSKRIPPGDPLHFLLDLPLNLSRDVKETWVEISGIKFKKFFHAILPPPGRQSTAITRIGRSSYLLRQVPGLKKGELPLLLRVSFHPDWNTFGQRYFAKYFSEKKLPEALEKKALSLKKGKKLAPEEKLNILLAALPSGKEEKGRDHKRAALLTAAGRKAGIEVFPLLAAPAPFLNPSTAGDLFTDIFLLFHQGKREGIRSFSGRKLAPIPEKFHNGSMLILRGNSGQLRKIPHLSAGKDR